MSSNGRSASPYVDAPIDGPEIKTIKSKAKAKGKQGASNLFHSTHMCELTCLQDEEQNGNQKRVSGLSSRMEVAYACLKPGTPTISPAKKQKKGKTNRKKLVFEKTVINVIFRSSRTTSRDWSAISSSWQRKYLRSIQCIHVETFVHTS